MLLSRRSLLALACAACTLAAGARPAAAQDFVAGAAGGAAGVAAGAYVSLTIVVIESRAGEYLLGIDDFLGWRSAPVLIGGGTGMMIGLLDAPRLWDTVLWGAGGTAVGTGVGLALGPLLWDDPAARWAGGAIGAGAGLVAGSLFGLLVKGGSGSDDDRRGGASSAGVPILIRIRL